MKVTREVVTDLLPIYFAGEASGDTKVLVEDYFRQDPDFARIARTAATPLKTLRTVKPIAPTAEREKRDLKSVMWGLRRRTWLFGVSLFLTLAPLSFDFTDGLSRMIREVPWHAAFDWSLAVVLWFVYFAPLPWRTAKLVVAILFTLIPIPFVLHSVLAGGRILEFAIIWGWAAFAWLSYFRRRSC